jgi:hypothetical protein
MSTILPGVLRINNRVHVVANILDFNDNGTTITLTRTDSSTVVVDSSTDLQAYNALQWWLSKNLDLVADYQEKALRGEL